MPDTSTESITPLVPLASVIGPSRSDDDTTVIDGPRPAPVAAPPPSRRESTFRDVWQRTEPRYRIRAIVLLGLNLALFCGLCVFTHWLHVGRSFDFSFSSYWAPARFWGQTAPNLNDFILYPINVLLTPVHALVLGLLVASIVAVPILVAMLYRFLASVPFLLAVLVLAHMPWMSVTLLGSVLLVSLRPLRLNFRFASGLLGMLPVILYLVLATRESGETLGSVSPAQQSLLAAPWVLAVIAACGMIAIVLWIARLVDYRPGAVAPVVAVMFATPVLLFHAKVGVDELTYRMLEAEYGPRSPRFQPVQDAERQLRALVPALLLDDALYARHRGEFLAALRGESAPVRRLIWKYMLTTFLTDRADAYEACKEFIANHPDSRYVPNALYIQARVLDTRLDERTLTDLRREIYAEFPHVQSYEPWLKLLKQFPDSPLAIAAATRLAEHEVRRGDIEAAVERLRFVQKRAYAASAPPAGVEQAAISLFSTAPATTSLEFDPRPFRDEAHQLDELIGANRDDPLYGNAPLQELAGLDPRRDGYAEQIRRLVQKYRDSRLADNLLVRWAMTLQDPRERARQLELVLGAHPDGDATPEALFRLANIELQTLSTDEPEARTRGLNRLQQTVERYPASFWGMEAANLLRSLGPRAATQAAPS